MQFLEKLSVLLVLLFLTSCSSDRASQEERPYDENADAKEEITGALENLPDDKFLLVIFGANWCEDCIVLDKRMKNGPMRDAIADNFTVVKVDIGEWDRNLDVVSWFGDPISNGIPSIAVADSERKILHVTTAGEFASIRSQSKESTHEYFSELARTLRIQAKTR